MSSFPSKPHELRVHVLHFSQHFLVFQFFFRMAKFCLQMTRRVLNSPTFLWQSSSKGLSLSTWSGLFQQWPSPREQLSLWVISSLSWAMTKSWTWQEAQSNLREAQCLLVCSCHVRDGMVVGEVPVPPAWKEREVKAAAQCRASKPSHLDGPSAPSPNKAFLP